MHETQLQPILGLGEEFPDTLFLLHHPASGKYGCYCFRGVHGLACFSDDAQAEVFAEWMDVNGMSVEETDFDDAREVAKSRPMPVIALMLLDDLDEPLIHYVR